MSTPARGSLGALRGSWIYAVVPLAIALSAVLLRPPIELTSPNRLVTASVAAVIALGVAFLTVFLITRFPHRGTWIWWAAVSLVAALALGVVLLQYQELRLRYSVELHGLNVVVGVADELTPLGKIHHDQYGDSPTVTVQKIGQPDVVWQIDALKRHARQMERYYYACCALTTLWGMSWIGVWRARQRLLAADVRRDAPDRVGAPKTQRRFRVALSFPGEVRERAAGIADILEGALGKDQVFYDRWYAAELARPNLDLHLQNIYKNDADLLVVLLCAEYEAKDWCGLEWRVVRDFIKNRQSERIMLLRLDDATISGLLSIDGYLDIASLGDRDVAAAIVSRVGDTSNN